MKLVSTLLDLPLVVQNGVFQDYLCWNIHKIFHFSWESVKGKQNWLILWLNRVQEHPSLPNLLLH